MGIGAPIHGNEGVTHSGAIRCTTVISCKSIPGATDILEGFIQQAPEIS